MNDDLDRGLLARLSYGHAAADLCQGAVPALIPFFVIQRGWSYAAAGLLVLAMTVGSSIVQPLFGAVADRLETSDLDDPRDLRRFAREMGREMGAESGEDLTDELEALMEEEAGGTASGVGGDDGTIY